MKISKKEEMYVEKYYEFYFTTLRLLTQSFYTMWIKTVNYRYVYFGTCL